eukprot:gnl/TRDRNA2_/TRDRNA2_88476_c0_seq1.p1 gnl/TRDRNA2_/TRDRNA2_88476_c0~~gnl/TRDRNA2_/TRDRNA2_88476_c0_seq1.p1  ORF type:complete len:1050 (-),score=210.33 gnl/TRDRNA2_/TRDRNA2_88476_c0_seq1:366-3515(-)
MAPFPRTTASEKMARHQRSRCEWLCIVLAAAQLLTSFAVLATYGTGERLVSPDPHEIAHFDFAKTMLVPSFLLEMCHFLSASAQGSRKMPGFHMSIFVMIEFLIQIVCYFSMAQFDGGVVHVNQRAFGAPRGCYTFRYVDWAIAVPMLVAINIHPLMSAMPVQEFIMRMLPSLAVAFGYIFASWVALITPSALAGWSLITLAFLSFSASVADQASIILRNRECVRNYKFKAGVVILKVIIFIVYGMCFLFGCFNIVTSLTEQIFYTYGDVVLKVVVQSCLLICRNWEEIIEVQQSLETEVIQSEESISLLIRKASVPMIVMDHDGHIIGWNEHLACLSNISPDVAIGQKFHRLIEEDGRESVINALASSAQGKSTGVVELILVAPEVACGEVADGERRGHVQLVMNFVARFGKNAAQIVAVGQDLTQLVALKSMQERKARFQAIVGHELRSPLHGIAGLSAAMSEDEAASVAQKKSLAMISSCAKRLLDLVTNIMETAAIDAKALDNPNVDEHDAPTSPINMMDIADEVTEMTRLAVGRNGDSLVGKKVKLVNNMKEGVLPLARGDAYKVTQLLYNLVTNACKFTREGSVTLSARHDRENSMVEVDVEDTGVGIKPEALKRIFEPFEQENNADSRSFQGIGLGLSVAHGIAKLHKGEILVKSTVGKGSTFIVRLPCENDQVQGLTYKDSVALSLPKGNRDDKPLLLSVDDDEVNQQVIENALGNAYRIQRAMNGTDALTFLKDSEELPAAVLLDVMMPGLTGFDVCSEIRQKLKHGHLELPVLMLSAKAPHEETAKDCFQSGATDFMSKPFSTKVLKMRLGVVEDLKEEVDKVVEHLKQEVDAPLRTTEMMTGTEAAEAGQIRTELAKEVEKCQKELADVCMTHEQQRAAAAEQLQKEISARETVQAEARQERQAAAAESSALKRMVESLEQKLAAAVDATQANVRKELPSAAEQKSAAARIMPKTDIDSEIAWLHGEVHIRDEKIMQLRKKLDQRKTQSFFHQQRAEAASRKLAWLQSGSARRFGRVLDEYAAQSESSDDDLNRIAGA